MAPALFAPAPAAPRPATASGTSVLPGVALPSWARPSGSVPPAVAPLDTEVTDAAATDTLPPEAGLDDGQHPATAATAAEAADGLGPALEPPASAPAPDTFASALPELGHAAWDAPAPDPLPGSHRFLPVDQDSEQASPGRGRLLILLGLVAVLVLAAFAAFVTPGFLTASGEDPAMAPVPAAPAAAVPVAATDYFTRWASAMNVGVTDVTKVEGLPTGTSARCGSATVGGAAGTACAFSAPDSQGTVWYPKTGLKPASKRVAALATAAAR